MAHYPIPKNAKTDLPTILAMARNLGIRLNEPERTIFKPTNIKVSTKMRWVLGEMHKWGFKVQLEIPISRHTVSRKTENQ